MAGGARSDLGPELILLAFVAFIGFSFGRCSAPDESRDAYVEEQESHRLTREAWMETLDAFAVYASRNGDHDLADEIYDFRDNPSGSSQYDYMGDPDPSG